MSGGWQRDSPKSAVLLLHLFHHSVLPHLYPPSMVQKPKRTVSCDGTVNRRGDRIEKSPRPIDVTAGEIDSRSRLSLKDTVSPASHRVDSPHSTADDPSILSRPRNERMASDCGGGARDSILVGGNGTSERSQRFQTRMTLRPFQFCFWCSSKPVPPVSILHTNNKINKKRRRRKYKNNPLVVRSTRLGWGSRPQQSRR